MRKLTTNSQIRTPCGVAMLALLCFATFANDQTRHAVVAPLSLEMAITSAQRHDPWLTGNIHKQQSIAAMSIAVGTLPDPKISLSLANLPTDGFDFDQEAMTQAKIGIAQMFPRGDTLEIRRQQLKIQSEAYPYQRQDREAKIAVTVGGLWLDAYRVQQTITLIEKNRSLFEQLVDIAAASYSSALGKTRQQDIVRAQLELTRLDDRLVKLAQQKTHYQGLLLQWLTTFSMDSQSSANSSQATDYELHSVTLAQQLPQIALMNADVVYTRDWLKSEQLLPYLSGHPAVLAIDKNISETKAGITLAKQKYQPEWGVNASYSYRADDPMGRSRADLLSIGVTFDLPLFTENRQDNEVRSAIATTEAVKTEKLLLLRQLLGSYASAKGRLLRLKDQQQLYKSKLLPQSQDQAEASLTAYTNDDGDFAEVVRARIAVLNAEIDELTIDVEEQKIRLEINYLFIGNSKTAMTKNATTENATNHSNGNDYAAVFGEK